jgi:hypothetical protein
VSKHGYLGQYVGVVLVAVAGRFALKKTLSVGN